MAGELISLASPFFIDDLSVPGTVGDRVVAFDSLGNSAESKVTGIGTGRTFDTDFLAGIGAFTNWTGVTPNERPAGWTPQGGPYDAATRITEDPAGQCRMLTDGTQNSIRNGLIVPKDNLFLVTLDIKAISGRLRLRNVIDYTTPGLKSVYHNYTSSGNFWIDAITVPSDVTLDDLLLKKVLTPSIFGLVTDPWALDGPFNPNDIQSVEVRSPSSIVGMQDIFGRIFNGRVIPGV